jgi:hypothetical protein
MQQEDLQVCYLLIFFQMTRQIWICFF